MTGLEKSITVTLFTCTTLLMVTSEALVSKVAIRPFLTEGISISILFPVMTAI